METLRMLAHLHAVATEPDGLVALQRHTLTAGIVGSGLQLLVQEELDVVDVVRGER